MNCISSKTKNHPLNLQIHLALPGFLISQKMGELPKISTSPFNWHLQKHSHNNISIQENHFLPGRRKVFWAAEEFWKGKEKFQNSKYSTELEQHHVGGQRMEKQQKAHQEHPSFFTVKIPNLKSPVCIVFFQVSYHPAGLWGQGESSSKQHWKREKKKRINFLNCSHNCTVHPRAKARNANKNEVFQQEQQRQAGQRFIWNLNINIIPKNPKNPSLPSH